VFINYPHRKRTVPLRMFVPNLFTTIAMCCGLASMHYSLKGDWDRAMLAVLLSAVFDGLDGRAARLLRVASPFGEVLDSLADFLSFGVAPAMLIHQWMFSQAAVKAGVPPTLTDVFGLAAVITFVLCSAMRLARFTAAARPKQVSAAPPPPGEEQREVVLKSKFFQGLATPSAAAAVMVPIMLAYSKHVAPLVRPEYGMQLAEGGERLAQVDSPAAPPSAWVIWAVIVYTTLIALWMISRLPMFSFKKMRVNRRAAVPMLVGVGLIVALAVTDFWLMVSLLTLAYLCTLPLSLAARRRVLTRPVGELPELKTRPARGVR